MSERRLLLDPAHVQIVHQFAGADVLLAFDFDGTLAPLTDRPADATMRRSTRRLLAAVARRYPTVVISGRAVADVSSKLTGVPVCLVFGNHGLEGMAGSRLPAGVITDWLRHLRAAVPPELGVEIEDKVFSVTLHYRRAHPKRAALAAIARAVRELSDVRILHGKECVNLLPAGGGGKATALEYAVAAFGCSHALYVGDDVTDEEAFRAGGVGELLSVRVGLSRTSQASFFLDRQEDIDQLLTLLLARRQAGTHSAATPPG